MIYKWDYFQEVCEGIHQYVSGSNKTTSNKTVNRLILIVFARKLTAEKVED